MFVIFISIIAVTYAAFLTNRYIRRLKIRKQFEIVSNRSIDKSCLMLTNLPCSSIIDKALECLSNHDNIEVCKNHRLGSETLKILGRTVREYANDENESERRPAVYHEHMLEATEKIAETTRHIITSPDNYVPMTYKCEIETIRESLVRLSQSADNILRADGNTDQIRAEISNDKAFIEHTIAVHSKEMTHEEFDEGAPAYSYLMLLYYLHAFVSSFSQVIKNIEMNNNQKTA